MSFPLNKPYILNTYIFNHQLVIYEISRIFQETQLILDEIIGETIRRINLILSELEKPNGLISYKTIDKIEEEFNKRIKGRYINRTL